MSNHLVRAGKIAELARVKTTLQLVYLLLFLSLGLNYFLSPDLLIGLPTAARAVSSILLLSLPFFLSGLIFSESLRRAREAAGPLASPVLCLDFLRLPSKRRIILVDGV